MQKRTIKFQVNANFIKKRLAVIFVMIALLGILFSSCGNSKNLPYYKVKLVRYEDYKTKYQKLVNYLNAYDNDASTMCYSVLRDLVVFEADIKYELDENQAFDSYQLDTLTIMLQQVTALRKFVDCIAWCTEHPVIQEKELATATQILQYRVLPIDSSKCAKVVEIQKERYLHYFLINRTDQHRSIRYTYSNFEGENDSGLAQLPPYSAAAFFGIFNDYYNDWLIMRGIQCN